MVSNRPYITVMKDLEKRREAQLLIQKKAADEIEELNQLIAGLRKVAVTPLPTPADSALPDNVMKPQPTMSMRWAILNILGVFSAAPMSVSEVVEALKGMSFPDNSKLRGNASAVLSRMGALREVVNAGNSYSITEVGLRSLEAIQMKSSVVATNDHNMNLYSSSTGTDAEEEGD